MISNGGGAAELSSESQAQRRWVHTVTQNQIRTRVTLMAAIGFETGRHPP